MTAREQMIQLIDSLTDEQAAAGLRLLEALRDDLSSEVPNMSDDQLTTLLDSFPGLWEQVQESRTLYERGEYVPLSEL